MKIKLENGAIANYVNFLNCSGWILTSHFVDDIEHLGVDEDYSTQDNPIFSNLTNTNQLISVQQTFIPDPTKAIIWEAINDR